MAVLMPRDISRISALVEEGQLLTQEAELITRGEDFPPLKLIHYGKGEVLKMINMMEAAYDDLLLFPGGEGSAPMEAGAMWDPMQRPSKSGAKPRFGVRGARLRELVSIRAASLGFANDFELASVEEYLRNNGGWELDPVDSTSGNCMFHAVRKGLAVRHSVYDTKYPFFPSRYLRRMVVVWMVNNRQQLMRSKGASLKATYGVQGGDAYKEPLSLKEYLRLSLTRGHWGEDVHLYAISKIFDVRITVLNGHTLEEHRVRHGLALDQADLVLIYNGRDHFHGAVQNSDGSACFVDTEREVEFSTGKQSHPEDTDDSVGDSSECEAEGLDPTVSRARKTVHAVHFRRHVVHPVLKDDETLVKKDELARLRRDAEKGPKEGELVVGAAELAGLRQRAAALPGDGEVVVGAAELAGLRQRAAAPAQLKEGEVPVKKAELVHVARTLARLTGDVPAPEGADAGDVPFQVPRVDRGDKQCALCGRKFANSSRLRRHLATHVGDQPYECDRCGSKLSSRASFERHRTSCGVAKTRSCSVPGCTAKFATDALLRGHVRGHQNLPSEAETCECGQKFTKAKSKREHWSVCEKNPDRRGPFFCPVDGCNLKEKRHPFSRMKNLNAHLKTAHEHHPKRARKQ